MEKEYNERFISLRAIIDRVMSWPEMSDLQIDIAINATIDIIRSIGNPLFLKSEVTDVAIDNYIGILPDNFVDVIKVDRNDGGVRGAMTINADPFFTKYSTTTYPQPFKSMDFKYKIQGEYIHTSFIEGNVQVAYTTIPVDSDGIVMVPDRVSIVKAIEFGIISEWYLRKWIQKKVPEAVFRQMDKDKMWWVGKASTDFMLENLDKRQTIANVMNTLILNRYDYQNDFRETGNKEFRKRF